MRLNRFALLVATGVLVALPVHALRSQAKLTGTVREDSTGRPLADAEVAIEALGRATRTDDAGRFLLVDLPSGLRLVRAPQAHPSPIRLSDSGQESFVGWICGRRPRPERNAAHVI